MRGATAVKSQECTKEGWLPPLNGMLIFNIAVVSIIQFKVNLKSVREESCVGCAIMKPPEAKRV